MAIPRDPALLVAAARLYYLQGHSQADVAETLGTSRSNVSRMLTEAQRQGIVEIRIHDPAGRAHDLEDQLRELYGLRDVRVAHQARATKAGSRTDDLVGTQAARLLQEYLKDSMTLAVSWGHALQSMVYATTSEVDYHDLTLVQLVGGLSAIANEVSGQELVRELAVRLGAEYRFLHAPAALESGAARAALLAEPSIADAMSEAVRSDVAVVGIGTPVHGSSSKILDSLNLSPSEQRAFWAAGPAGDIAARYYDAQGRPIQGPVDDRILGIGLADLAAIPQVIGVAHGRAKTPGVLGALRGHLIDSLVCDESLARSLISGASPTSTTDSPSRNQRKK